nr:hypothetical protein DM860_000801 [Ipomoea trifida]
MPSKFQQTLYRIWKESPKPPKFTSTKPTNNSPNNFKPIVGNKYAPTVASFIFTPHIIVSLIFNRFKAYFSLQKLIIFVHIYLDIYFSILCLFFFFAQSWPTMVVASRDGVENGKGDKK